MKITNLRMRLAITIILMTILPSVIWADGIYSGGTGDPNYPYLISTAEDMNEIGEHIEDWSNCFVLTADINLIDFNESNFTIIGNSTTKFTGVFDGNNHTISNFTYNSTSTDNVGLFGYIESPNAEIKNLGLVNADVNAGTNYYVGALVGYNYEGTISNCYATGSITGKSKVGGLVGENKYGTVENCYTTGVVTGYLTKIGGLVGGNYYSIIENCYATCEVTGEYHCAGGLAGDNSGTISYCYVSGSVTGDYDVGGLAGDNSGTISYCYVSGSVTGNGAVGGLVGGGGYGTIENCYATGAVTGRVEIGGLVGVNYTPSTISNCYATGAVTGEGAVGGLMGDNYHCTIENCYATGAVTGERRVGGLMGYSYEGTISNCYSRGAVTGDYSIGGFCGSRPNSNPGVISNCFWDVQTSGMIESDGGIGLPTSVMQNYYTYEINGWDFVNDWWINEYRDYPKLIWQPWGDVNNDNHVDMRDIAVMGLAWYSNNGDINFNSVCELSGDWTIDADDLAEIGAAWLSGPAW